MTGSFLKTLSANDQLIAILIDPEKTNEVDALTDLIHKLNSCQPDFIFVGGSTVGAEDMAETLSYIKANTTIPVILFPGSYQQISDRADGILFLSLISGRNPDYLIGHQVASAHLLKEMEIEVIPTGYLLIDGGKPSAVAYVSQTTPIPTDQSKIAVKTAIAGELLGMHTLFLDAGSGALNPVPPQMIRAVKKETNLPLIVGGGLKSVADIQAAFAAGANLAVVGNKIEDDIDFLLDIKLLNSAKRKVAE